MIIIVVKNWPPYVKNSGYTPGGVVVSEIDMVVLLPWVMGFFIGVGAGYRQDRCDRCVVVVEISAVFFFFFWWFLWWVSLGGCRREFHLRLST